MSSSPFDTPPVLSFRNLLIETVSEFLCERQMPGMQTAEALSELIVSLSSYREEGFPLFPQVFICEDIQDISSLNGFDLRRISEGDRSRATMRRALKQCAPLSRGGWSIYFELSGQDRFNYGLFRTDNFILTSTPIERLRGNTEMQCRILGISRLAENIIEISASGGYRRFIHLAGARTDVPHPTKVLDSFVKAVTADVKIDTDIVPRPTVEKFFRHVFFDVMQAPYGCLAMVVPADNPASELLDDGVMLAPQIDVVAAITTYYSDPSALNATALQSIATLLKGMLSADGITVLRSDASLVGYNVFVGQQTVRAGETPIGGARLRSYNVLRQHIGRDLTAAFYRSQDGVALCETVETMREGQMQIRQVSAAPQSPVQPQVQPAVPPMMPAYAAAQTQQPMPAVPAMRQSNSGTPIPVPQTPQPQPMMVSQGQPPMMAAPNQMPAPSLTSVPQMPTMPQMPAMQPMAASMAPGAVSPAMPQAISQGMQVPMTGAVPAMNHPAQMSVPPQGPMQAAFQLTPPPAPYPPMAVQTAVSQKPQSSSFPMAQAQSQPQMAASEGNVSYGSMPPAVRSPSAQPQPVQEMPSSPPQPPPQPTYGQTNRARAVIEALCRSDPPSASPAPTVPPVSQVSGTAAPNQSSPKVQSPTSDEPSRPLAGAASSAPETVQLTPPPVMPASQQPSPSLPPMAQPPVGNFLAEP